MSNNTGDSWFKPVRKRVLYFMPLMRRSRHEKALARARSYLQQRYDEEHRTNEAMASLFFAPMSMASAARCAMPVSIKKDAAVDELALFVTHASHATLKPHVVDHVNALLDAGVAVLLIANSDLGVAEIGLPADLATRLYGFMVRANLGFDFAAWGHAYSLIDRGRIRQRLYLINDSIIGPLDPTGYRTLLERIRRTPADIVGLTSNPYPHAHLQSFYLVFGSRLLHSEICDEFLKNIVNMPSKQHVIDCYELWLSRFLERAGFSSAAMFPNLSDEGSLFRDDVYYRWAQLIEAGFPFIKSRILTDPGQMESARRFVPSRYFPQDRGFAKPLEV